MNPHAHRALSNSSTKFFNMTCVAVAVSGGADSLYALVRAAEQRQQAQGQASSVIALHGLFLPEKDTNAEALTALEKLCTERNIPLHILDFRKEFSQSVIRPFIQAYAKGLTPNPCALCNRQVKFGLLMDAALQLGADIFTTGHYAALNATADLAQSPLCKGHDIRKDQSYFLSLVPRERFAKVRFPLASTKKTDNILYLQERSIAIPVAQESQEICFVPADAYREFLLENSKKYNITLGKGGKIYVKEQGQETLLPKKFGGSLGNTHGGLWQYTEGQRRGLGIAWKEPLYVCAKDCARNALILSNKEEATLQGCSTGKVNFLVAPELWPQEVLVRVRYRQQEVPAKVHIKNHGLHVEFASPQSPTAPGQIAAVYDAEGAILAGGIIEKVW